MISAINRQKIAGVGTSTELKCKSEAGARVGINTSTVFTVIALNSPRHCTIESINGGQVIFCSFEFRLATQLKSNETRENLPI